MFVSQENVSRGGGQLNIKERKREQGSKEQTMEVFRIWADEVVPLPETGGKETKTCVVVHMFKAKAKEIEGEQRSTGVLGLCPNNCMTKIQSLSVSWSLISKTKILCLTR